MVHSNELLEYKGPPSNIISSGFRLTFVTFEKEHLIFIVTTYVVHLVRLFCSPRGWLSTSHTRILYHEYPLDASQIHQRQVLRSHLAHLPPPIPVCILTLPSTPSVMLIRFCLFGHPESLPPIPPPSMYSVPPVLSEFVCYPSLEMFGSLRT